MYNPDDGVYVDMLNNDFIIKAYHHAFCMVMIEPTLV
jgi:hypothetical protein